MPPILEIENLSVRYHDGTEALKDVSLSIEQRCRVGLIGPNGAGKTSLLLGIMGGVTCTGRVAVDGVELSRRTAPQVRSRCGMTFQESDDQLFSPTLLDDVGFGPLNQGLDEADAEQRARDAIAAVGLAGLETHCAHHLSGGQKRLAALATILSMQVKLLLLDEPGANLDCRSRKRLIDILRGREEAMLLATHDLDMIQQLCRRVILLDTGRIIADGEGGGILNDSSLLTAHGLE